MNFFSQAVINGIMVGSIYALIGISLTLIFGVMKVINFCQGEMVMLGMYVTYVLYSLCGIDTFLAIPIVALVMFLFGVLIQSSLITRSIKGKDDSHILFLTVGLGILFKNLALIIFKSDYYTAKSFVTGRTILIGDVIISLPKLISFLILLLVTLLLFLFLKYTMLGKQIRATAQNTIGAKVTGIKTNRIYSATYGLGAAIAGIAGACLMSYYYVFPSVGDTYGTRAFIVVTLGGLGSTVGAFLGGIGLGLMETIGSMTVGSSFKDTIVFLVFILILVFKQNIILRRSRG